MLGSLSEADDPVQEARLCLARADTRGVEKLDMSRSRQSRREESLDAHLPGPIVSRVDGTDPQHVALLAGSVGLALLVVLDSLAPAEPLAFVLHDMFAMPVEEIAPLVGRSPTAARQLASRARRRAQGSAPVPDPGLTGRCQVVDAFLAAARDGDFDALLAVLDPDVVLRADAGAGRAGALRVVRGATAVAAGAFAFARLARSARPALVNGAAGGVSWGPAGRPLSVMGFTVSGGKIVEIDVLADPSRLRGRDPAVLRH
jgi:RNA polymerase sigma-70 factor (ECF subfamily)